MLTNIMDFNNFKPWVKVKIKNAINLVKDVKDPMFRIAQRIKHNSARGIDYVKILEETGRR